MIYIVFAILALCGLIVIIAEIIGLCQAAKRGDEQLPEPMSGRAKWEKAREIKNKVGKGLENL